MGLRNVLLGVVLLQCPQKLRLLKGVIPATKHTSEVPVVEICAGARDKLPLISHDLGFAPAALLGMRSLRVGRPSKTFGCLVAHAQTCNKHGHICLHAWLGESYNLAMFTINED